MPYFSEHQISISPKSSEYFKNENKNIDEQQKCMILFMHTHKYGILKTANYTGVSIDVSFCKL
jgi:hypothetical protein